MVSSSRGLEANIQIARDHPFALLANIFPIGNLGFMTIPDLMAAQLDLKVGGSVGSNSLLSIQGILESGLLSSILTLLGYCFFISFIIVNLGKASKINRFWLASLVVSGSTQLKFWRQDLIGSFNTAWLCFLYIVVSILLIAVIDFLSDDPSYQKT
jgi:hypothetical protein